MQGVKRTHFRSHFNSRLGVKRTLFFRNKNDPNFGVKLGVKVTPKKGLCTENFYSIFGVIITP